MAATVLVLAGVAVIAMARQDSKVPEVAEEVKPMAVPAHSIGRPEGPMHMAARLTQEQREVLQITAEDDWVATLPTGVLVE